MKRFLAVLALLAPAAVGAESYSHVLTFNVPTGATGIAATHADKFFIIGAFGEGVSYDSIYLTGGLAGGRSYNGDGYGLSSIAVDGSAKYVAISSFSTGGEKIVFSCRLGTAVSADQTNPNRSSGFSTPCRVPGSAIASDREGYCYVFAGCGESIEVRKLGPWPGNTDEAPILETFGSFTAPRFVAVSPDGHVYVTSDLGVSKFGPDGTPLGDWSLGDAGPIATDAYGNVFVIDVASATVYKFSPDGSQMASWQSGCRTGIAVSDYDSVYLLSDRGRVEKFEIDHSTPAVATTWGQVKARWR